MLVETCARAGSLRMFLCSRWNEQFIIDVQPDEIYGSKMVIELCERLPSGDDLVVGLVLPPIGTQH